MSRFKIKSFNDKPVDNAILLNHDKIVENLKNFIESDTMITPLSIAIHGEWGSGKTSIMKTLANKLDSLQSQVIFFEPWRYENADPPLALAQIIGNKLDNSQNKAVARDIVLMAANSISKKFVGLDIGDISAYINKNISAVDNFSHKLENLIKNNLQGKNLIIIVDDLDRCNVENTLLILSIMKLFLEIDNCVCIAAVDFKRLEQAWKAKYQIKDESVDGREYLEKIFQIRIGLPIPSNEELVEYVKSLVPNMPENMIELFGYAGPHNPRAIKRMLNLIAFRASLLNSNTNYISAALWTVLENIIGNEPLVHLHDRYSDSSGNDLILAIARYNHDWSRLKQFVYAGYGFIETQKLNPLLEQFFLSASRVLKPLSSTSQIKHDFDILKVVTNEGVRF